MNPYGGRLTRWSQPLSGGDSQRWSPGFGAAGSEAPEEWLGEWKEHFLGLMPPVWLVCVFVGVRAQRRPCLEGARRWTAL